MQFAQAGVPNHEMSLHRCDRKNPQERCDASWSLAEAEGFSTMTVKRHDTARHEGPGPVRLLRISDNHRYWFMGRRWYAADQSLLPLACDRELGLRGARTRIVARKLGWSLRALVSR